MGSPVHLFSHIEEIYEEDELRPETTIQKYRTVRTEGGCGKNHTPETVEQI